MLHVRLFGNTHARRGGGVYGERRAIRAAADVECDRVCVLEELQPPRTGLRVNNIFSRKRAVNIRIRADDAQLERTNFCLRIRSRYHRKTKTNASNICFFFFLILLLGHLEFSDLTSDTPQHQHL